MLAWYTELIALRRAWPELTDPMLDQVRADYDESKRWLVLHRGRLRVVVNLGEQAQRLPLGQRRHRGAGRVPDRGDPGRHGR